MHMSKEELQRKIDLRKVPLFIILILIGLVSLYFIKPTSKNLPEGILIIDKLSYLIIGFGAIIFLVATFKFIYSKKR